MLPILLSIHHYIERRCIYFEAERLVNLRKRDVTRDITFRVFAQNAHFLLFVFDDDEGSISWAANLLT